MDAKMGDEDENGVGLRVIDNNGVSHGIHVGFDGEITYHEQDGYPDDPSERTHEENAHVNQARRYAQWYVYSERGYDTTRTYENPDRLVGAMLGVANCSDAQFHQQFGTLKEQVQRHSDGNPVELPFDNVSPEEIVIYRTDIWLDRDPTETEPPLLDQYIEAASDPLATISRALEENSLPYEQLPEFEIEAVSEMHYLYTDGISQQTHWNDQPLDREPDARVELLPLDIESFGPFKAMVLSHLGFQIRDCFLDMGTEPPDVLQVRGPGKYNSMVKQRLLDMYEPYFRPSGDVEINETQLG